MSAHTGDLLFQPSPSSLPQAPLSCWWEVPWGRDLPGYQTELSGFNNYPIELAVTTQTEMNGSNRLPELTLQTISSHFHISALVSPRAASNKITRDTQCCARLDVHAGPAGAGAGHAWGSGMAGSHQPAASGTTGQALHPQTTSSKLFFFSSKQPGWSRAGRQRLCCSGTGILQALKQHPCYSTLSTFQPAIALTVTSPLLSRCRLLCPQRKASCCFFLLPLGWLPCRSQYS